MKVLAAIILMGAAAGCQATPIDILIPTRKPSPPTKEFLGHMCPTNYVNGMYHSLLDTKIEEAFVPLRQMELQGLYYVAKGETGLIAEMGTNASNMIWGGITAALTAAGIMIPRPQEKHRVEAARLTPVPEQKDGN